MDSLDILALFLVPITLVVLWYIDRTEGKRDLDFIGRIASRLPQQPFLEEVFLEQYHLHDTQIAEYLKHTLKRRLLQHERGAVLRALGHMSLQYLCQEHLVVGRMISLRTLEEEYPSLYAEAQARGVLKRDLSHRYTVWEYTEKGACAPSLFESRDTRRKAELMLLLPDYA